MVDLTSNLFPVDSPIARNQGQVSAFQFDSDNERGVISAAKVRDFSFNQAQGGTLTLGGANNGNGVLNINNSSGSSLITADNTGLTIKANNGTTIIDNIGIISQSNFKSDTKIDTNIYTTTSSSYVDVTGGTLEPFIITRPTKVLMYLDVTGANYDNQNNITYYSQFILTDGTNNYITQAIIGQYLIQGGSVFGLTSQEQVQIVISSLGSATYNLKVQHQIVNGGTSTLEYLRLGYVILGS